jgi:hypothetical protein
MVGARSTPATRPGKPQKRVSAESSSPPHETLEQSRCRRAFCFVIVVFVVVFRTKSHSRGRSL